MAITRGMDTDPLIYRVPDHPPEAVQVVELGADHERSGPTLMVIHDTPVGGAFSMKRCR